MDQIDVDSVAPGIRPLVEEVVRTGRIGVCPGNISVADIRSGRSSFADAGRSGDRFKIVIPFGGTSLTWDVVFVGNTSEYPPDFNFDDKSFCPNIDELTSLRNWDSKDHSILLRLIEELVECYRRHQVALAEKHDRLHLEYTTVIGLNDFSEQDVEIVVNKKNKNGPTNLLIRLPIDFSKIPPTLGNFNVGDESAVLFITFTSREANVKIIPQLFLSPRVEHALGGGSNLRIPMFPSGGCLMDYVPQVCQLLKNKIEQVAVGFEKRKEYVAAFLRRFGRSLLEFDAQRFSKLSFLFEWKEFYFMLHISIPLYFPQDRPVFKLQSIYHMACNQPFTRICSDYPYSPRWDSEEMADRARIFLLDYVPKFKRDSTHGGM